MKKKIIFVVLLFVILVYLIIYKYTLLTSEINGEKYKILSNIKTYSNKKGLNKTRLKTLLMIAVKNNSVDNNEYLNIKSEYDKIVLEEERSIFLRK